MANIQDVLSRLKATEQGIAGTELLAPILAGHPVAVRIGGVFCKLRVGRLPSLTEPFAVLRVLNTDRAEFLRHPARREIDQYLALFPPVRLVALMKDDHDRWLAYPYALGDKRFNFDGPVILQRAPASLAQMDVLRARFDGSFFWYETRGAGAAVKHADLLRAELAKFEADGDVEPAKPDGLRISGLVPEHRMAYAIALAALGEKGDKVAQRLQSALKHAGAQFQEYAERDGSYVVHYTVDGTQHTSLVSAADLTVQTAGICLSRGDAAFDLTSLVSVLREGVRRRLIVNTPLREARGAFIEARDEGHDRNIWEDDEDDE